LKIEEHKRSKDLKIIQELKPIYPLLNDDVILQLYNKSVSLHQSRVQNNGDFLENEILSNILNKNNIIYKKQVCIDDSGTIIGFSRKKCYHVIDFVVGIDVEIGKSITNYKVISCKTTCRERWTQDNWSYKLIPIKFILLTISNDYPPSSRFMESDKRKIITCIPKNKDDRLFKLNFEDLIKELV
jgi:arsenate reductase-like glutaredoxin family protein